MPSVLVDAGPLIALFDTGDNHHRQALQFMKRTEAKLYTNWPVLAEVMANLDFSVEAQIAALDWASASAQVDNATGNDVERITEIMGKYCDLPADFADASLVALGERIGVLDVASIDRDFDVYRTKDRRRFRNVFFER
jgi:predicted nucleic acid-binding protein